MELLRKATVNEQSFYELLSMSSRAHSEPRSAHDIISSIQKSLRAEEMDTLPLQPWVPA